MSNTRVPAALRARVAQQAGRRCGYCLTAEDIVGTPLEIDHIVPEARGGPTVEANLWLACSMCNTFKGDRTSALDPLSGEAATLFDPRRQRWGEHFAWTHGGRRVAGRTATGRATVEALSSIGRCSSAHVRSGYVSVLIPRRGSTTACYPPNDRAAA